MRGRLGDKSTLAAAAELWCMAERENCMTSLFMNETERLTHKMIFCIHKISFICISFLKRAISLNKRGHCSDIIIKATCCKTNSVKINVILVQVLLE